MASSEENLGEIFFNCGESTDSEAEEVEVCGNDDHIAGELDETGEAAEDESMRGAKLGISEAVAQENYFMAGQEVEEEEDRITLDGNIYLITREVDEILDKIVADLNLPYKPSPFQRVSVNALGSQKTLILVSPTGSGKFDVPLLSILVLREKLNNDKGVAIITQPLTSIMNSKMVNRICDVAVLSMTGDLKTSCSEEDADLSCDVADLLDGRFPVLLGHPESFDSPLGQYILRELQRKERLLLVCIDEFHQGGEAHWSAFRPSMMRLSTGLRLYGVKNCPSVCMTATSTGKEIDEVVKALGLRTPPVILTSSPILNHLKFSIIRRPSNNFGLEGTVTSKGLRNEGLLDLVDRVYLRQFVEDLEAGVEPKKAIIFSRQNGVLGSIYSHLMDITKFKYRDCRDSPFVLNHSSLLPPTEKVITDRASEISLYLSSNKMLLGIDLPQIDIIIFLRPYNQLAALVQGGGRGGRRMENGLRRRVQVYQFYNSQDFSMQNKLMSPDMKRICMSRECTRQLLEDYFVGDSETSDKPAPDPNWCCHNCDLRKMLQD